MNTTYGYIFARSRQEEDTQLEILTKLSISEENIFTDRVPESGTERPMLRRLARKLHAGDLVYIKNMSWLGNSYDDILEQWRFLTKEKEADIAVLDAPLLDTRRGKEFMETFLSDIVAETLLFVSVNERTKNRRRQAEGYLAAKARGVRFGRPAAPLPENFDSVYRRWKDGKMTGTLAARECNMPLSTFRYRAKLYEKNKES